MKLNVAARLAGGIVAGFVALFFLLMAAAAAFGQDCPDGMCPWVKKPMKVAPSIGSGHDDSFSWVKNTSDQWLLKRNGVTIGQWYVPNNTYYPWNGKILPATKPPIDPPSALKMTEEMKLLIHNGIDRPDHNGERLNFSGKLIYPGKLAQAFSGQLQDDSDKGYLVIISKDQAITDSVFTDWKTLPDDFTSRFLVWRAPPDHFSMQDRFSKKPRFFTEGDPTVVLQSRDGTVLFRRPQAGQVYKTADMKDILKSDPTYQPALDPGGQPPAVSFSLSTQSTTSLALVGAGLLAIFLRRKS